jgi:MFS family permease
LSKTTAFKRIEITAYLLSAIGPMAGNAVLVLQGEIASNFVVNPEAVLLAMFSFMVPFAALQLFSGAISDTRGRVPVISVGMIIYISGMIASVLSISLNMFLIANFFQGIGYAFVNPVLIALVTDVSIPAEIPKKMGYFGAIGALSVGTGPLIAGQLVIFGWRFFYMVFSILSIIGVIAIRTAVSPRIEAPLGSGVRLVANHISQELRKPIVLLMMFSSMMIALTYAGIRVWTSTGLTGAVGEDIIGILLMMVGAAGVLAGVSMSKIVKYGGIGATLILGLASLFSSLLLFISIGDITLPGNIVLVGLALLFAGWAGGTLSPIVNTYSQVISPQRRGVLAGLIMSTLFVGQGAVTIVYQQLFIVGMGAIYMTMLLIAILLSVFLATLFKTAPQPPRQ